MAIYSHSNETESRWGKGGFKAMICSSTSDRPMGYCDGTQEDEDELIKTAESEGLEDVYMHKKTLKTGREIWTVRGEMNVPEEVEF